MTDPVTPNMRAIRLFGLTDSAFCFHGFERFFDIETRVVHGHIPQPL